MIMESRSEFSEILMPQPNCFRDIHDRETRSDVGNISQETSKECFSQNSAIFKRSYAYCRRSDTFTLRPRYVKFAFPEGPFGSPAAQCCAMDL